MTERKRIIGEVQRILGENFEYKWIYEQRYNEDTANMYPFLYRSGKSINKKMVGQIIDEGISKLESPESQPLVGYGVAYELDPYESENDRGILLVVRTIPEYKSEIDGYQKIQERLDGEMRTWQSKIDKIKFKIDNIKLLTNKSE